jgi:hypothetical protein
MRRALVLTLTALSLAVGVSPASSAPDAVGSRPSKPLPHLAPMPRDGLTRALQSGRLSEARYALLRWSSVWHPARARARFGAVARPAPLAGTLLARDLALRLGELHGRPRARAIALLSRPTDGASDPEGDGYTVGEATPLCTPDVCVHYVKTTPDKVPPADVDTNSVPDYVETVSSVMTHVWQSEVDGYGYREPKSDLSSDNNGGNAKLDVYLANIGNSNLYGYCTTDDPHAAPGSGYRYYDFSAYCVLDNDYAEFGPNPILPLKVTAAHEFFHAVQAAYDWTEDTWLIEGSAAWMEDEVYDAIDDNLQYLSSGPITFPTISLDRNPQAGLRVYGDWIFWRFLTEYFGTSTASDPTVIRQIWSKADGSPVGPDQYSTQATANTIASRKLDGTWWKLAWAFADFGVWNVVPKKYYEEGAKYPSAAIQVKRKVTGSTASIATSAIQDHLTNRYIQLKRGSGVRGTAKLKISVNGPMPATSPEASVVIVKSGGGVSFRVFSLDGSGDGTMSVGFGTGIARVVIVTTNGSARYKDCYSSKTDYSCYGGVPIDQDLKFSVKAKLIQ